MINPAAMGRAQNGGVPRTVLIVEDDESISMGLEMNLTAEGYRKQLEVNYSLRLPPDQVTPYIDARFNIKGSGEYPRWLRAFVSSAQMIYREPVVHEIPLITQPTLFIMGADDHNAPGKPNAPEALRPKMGQNADLAKALAAKMPDARAEVLANAGHLVFLDAPQKFNELMLAFLGSRAITHWMVAALGGS